jgi:hypothetical protein
VFVVPPDKRIPLTVVDVPVAPVVIPYTLFLNTLIDVPPEINIPSTVALAVLVAAPTDMFVTVLEKRLAPELAAIAIPLTVGAVVIIPVKFIAVNVLFVTEWAPVPVVIANPVIALGAVLDETIFRVFPLKL